MKNISVQKMLLAAAIAASLIFAACLTGDDGEGTDSSVIPEGKYRIRNWFNGSVNNDETFLYDNSGILGIQAEADNDAQFWNVEIRNGKILFKNVLSSNYINMAGVTPSWGGDDASEGKAKVSPFSDTEDFYWELVQGSGDQSDSYNIYTAKEWNGKKAVMSIQTSIDHQTPQVFKGTVQCRNDLNDTQLAWGAQYWTFYIFD